MSNASRTPDEPVTQRSGTRLRRIGAAVAGAALIVGIVGTASPANARPRTPSDTERQVTNSQRLSSDQVLCPIDDLRVPEYSPGVVGSTWLYPGESVQITAGGTIWAGVWFTGTNGPNGWSGSRADGSF